MNWKIKFYTLKKIISKHEIIYFYWESVNADLSLFLIEITHTHIHAYTHKHGFIIIKIKLIYPHRQNVTMLFLS